jgi:hypothetical protein
MAHIFNPKSIYDPATMPLVEGWELTNNCTFVRFHWVLTEADQKAVNEHWRPDFYRHSLINTKMSLATSAGRGIPGWDPYLGLSEEDAEKRDYETGDGLYDNTLSVKIAQGRHIKPTGLADDPRLPQPEPSSVSIVSLLQDAMARYPQEVAEEHEKMLAEWRALKSSWAGRMKAGPEPTLEDAKKARVARLGPSTGGWTQPGLWREWEIVEVEREKNRLRGIDEAEARCDAYMKSRYPCWGGGT